MSTLGAVTSLILGIVSVTLMSMLLSSNPSAQINVDLLQQLIDQQNATYARICQALIPAKNEMYANCLSAGDTECQAKLALENQPQPPNCTDRTNQLLSQIAAANVTMTNVTVVTNGIMQVLVGGTPGNFSLPYSVTRVVIGGSFRIYFITLPAWTSGPVASNATTVTYLVPNFCHYSDRRPLYDWDAFNLTVTAYEKSCNRIIFHLYGSPGLITQTRNVSLFL